jgi:uncharacterized small protein (DUF1192 family)
MSNEKNAKPAPKSQTDKNAGKPVESVDLSVEELEQRIAPKTMY